MSKKIHIEFLRIIAAFLVIFNHAEGFRLFTTYPADSIMYTISLLLSAFCKIAVPVFLMISGALMLNRDISLKDIWRKKISKIAIVLLIASFVYYLYNIKSNFSSFSLADFFKTIYTSYTSVHLWYLYAYLAFLACIPFLRAITTSLPTNAYIYLIVLRIVFSLVSLLRPFYDLPINTNLVPTWAFADIVFYPLLGYYLEHKLPIHNFSVRKTLLLVALALLSLLSSMWLTHWEYTSQGFFAQGYISFLCFIPAITMYIVSKKAFQTLKISNWVEKTILCISTCTFGTYLMHLVVPFRGKTTILLYDILNLPPMLAAISYCLVILIESTIITFFLRKLPVAKKLL